MLSLLCRVLKVWLLSFLVVSLCIFNIPPSMAESTGQNGTVVVLKPMKIKEGGVKDQVSDIPPAAQSAETPILPETAVHGTDSDEDNAESIDGLTMLYIGGAVAGVAVLAAALGSSGSSGSSVTDSIATTTTSSTPVTSSTSSSSSSSSSSTSSSSSSSSSSYPDNLPPVPEPTSVVGPNLNGSNWTGFLDIEDRGHEGYQRISARIDHSGSSVQIYTSSTLDYGRKFSGTISSSGYMLMYDSVTGEDWTSKSRNATSTRVDLYDYVNNFDDLDRMYLSR